MTQVVYQVFKNIGDGFKKVKSRLVIANELANVGVVAALKWRTPLHIQ